MLFNFELFALDDIQPWTTPSRGDEKHLHWFALTLGWYWIDTGVGELFRYSPEILKHWAQSYPSVTERPYVDYQVSRLWEDVLHMLPSVLEPIPDDLAACLWSGGLWEDSVAWKRWFKQAFEWSDRQKNGAGWDLFELASRWWSRKELVAGHLTTKPGVWFWREGDDIHIRWDNRDLLIDDIPAWASASGNVTLTAKDFLDGVQSFNDRLIQQMAERVETIQHHWSRPDISIDLKVLVKNQEYQATLLKDILAQAPEQTDWETVRTALAEMERHLAESMLQGNTG